MIFSKDVQLDLSKNDYSWDTSVTSLINDLQWKTLQSRTLSLN